MSGGTRAQPPREVLEDDIVAGRIKPGDRLDEQSLAGRFGVSRTPIREALRQLAAAGFVEIRPHRGAVVSAPDPYRMMEMFEVMAELEAMSARLAARRLTDAAEAELARTLKACERAARGGDTDSYYRENELFHRALYAAGGNRFLAEQATALHKRLAPYRRLQLRVRNRMRISQVEHQAIVAAIRAGDAQAAGLAAHNHVNVQGDRFNDLVASLERAEAS